MTKPLPFRKVSEAMYGTDFAKTCTAHQTRRGVQLTGTCPRCGEPMDYLILTRVFLSPGAAVAATQQRTVLCTCGTTHPDTPAGEEGCGAYWNVELSETAP